MKTEIQIDQIKYLYTKSKEKLLTESEALQTNITQTFWTTLKDKIEHKELINIAVQGEVRTGKSTVIIKIAYEMNKHLHAKGLNQDRHKNMHKYIFSDQTEFLRFINGDERNCAIVIDEFNTLAKTGLNATTEEALFDYYSDVFAGQYIHRITASPDIITDKNANIILYVIGKDENNHIVRCGLKYRDVVTKDQMTIGYVDIYVGDIITNWLDKVRHLIETKEAKTPKEKHIVEMWRAKDFYVRYQIKKYRRMKLIKEEGVRDIRELEFADIILGVILELQDYAKIQKVDTELINITADEIRRKHKRIYSILALNEIGQKSRAILGLLNKINQLSNKHKKSTVPTEKVIIGKTITQAQHLLNSRIEEQKKLSKLYQEYVNIQ